jgi:hypothetical protein
VHRIAERTFEPIPIEFSVVLHVADGWLECTVSPDYRAQSACDTTPQARLIDLYAIDRDTLVAAVHDRYLWRRVTQDRSLFQRFSRKRLTLCRSPPRVDDGMMGCDGHPAPAFRETLNGRSLGAGYAAACQGTAQKLSCALDATWLKNARYARKILAGAALGDSSSDATQP